MLELRWYRDGVTPFLLHSCFFHGTRIPSLRDVSLLGHRWFEVYRIAGIGTGHLAGQGLSTHGDFPELVWHSCSSGDQHPLGERDVLSGEVRDQAIKWPMWYNFITSRDVMDGLSRAIFSCEVKDMGPLPSVCT